MCVNPIHIKSNSRRYRPSLSRLSLDVPCGHCAECISHSQDEWFLRVWKEIKDCNDAGGKVVFMTLTYNPYHRPVFRDVDEGTGECFEIPCFSKAHKDRFLANLRDFYRKKHGFSVKRSKGLRFIWASEYGMTEGFQHCPHYHILLFFPKGFVDVFKSLSEFKKTLQHFWDYGFSYFSRKSDGGLFVTTEFAGAYVSKYMCKDVDFYGRKDVYDYIHNDDGTVNKAHYKKIKDSLPRHWQSKHFGETLCEYCDDDKVFVDGLDFNFIKDKKQGKAKHYKVPRYIERKLLRELDEYGSLVLNERGKRVYKQVYGFNEKLANLCEHNSDYLKLSNLLKLTNGDVSRAFEVKNRLEYINNGRHPWVLATYILVFRGLISGNPLLSRSKSEVYSPPEYSPPPETFSSLDSLYYYAKQLYDERMDGFHFNEPFFEEGFLNYYAESGRFDEKLSGKYEKFSDCFEIYDKLPIFAGYSEYLSIIFDLKREYRERCFLNYQLQRKENTKYKIGLTA